MTGSFVERRAFLGNTSLRRLLWALAVLVVVLLARIATESGTIPPSPAAAAPVDYNPYAEIVRLQERLRTFPEDSAAYAGL